MTGNGVRAAAAALLVLAAPAAAADLRTFAEVRPSQVAVDATLVLRVVVEGDAVGDVEPPSLSRLQGWTVVDGPSVSSQFRFINGVSSAATTFSWILAPSAPGTLTIPALEVQVGGQIHRTQPIQVKVTAAAAPGVGKKRPPPPVARRPGRPAETSQEDVFVRALVDSLDPFVGQQVILRYTLYTRAEVTAVPQLQELPTYPNFWAEEIKGPKRIGSRRELVNGLPYRVYTVRSMALFPTASGDTTLDSVTFSVPIRASNSSPFGRSFFFNTVQPVYRRTLPVTLHVRPLPAAGRPEGFTGAVGRFRLAVKSDRSRARLGEAIGMTVKVSGTGNLGSMSLPALVPGDAFTVFPPQVHESISTDDQGRLSGSKEWEYIVVPHVPGPQSLPPIRFSFFNPEDEAYQVLTSPALELEVTGTPVAESEGGTGPEHQEIRRLGRDIHFIKTPPWSPHPPRPPLYRTALFWIGLAAPPLLNLVGLLGRWQSRRARSRFAVSRRRRARRVALRTLKRAESAVSEPHGEGFYRHVARALTEFVADKSGHQATGLTYDRIASYLASRQVPDAKNQGFLRVLEECDCARFSPGPETAGARRAMLQRARQAVNDLERHL
ncbi:MAG: BatD family protein [Acidobacteriota bacterium]